MEEGLNIKARFLPAPKIYPQTLECLREKFKEYLKIKNEEITNSRHTLAQNIWKLKKRVKAEIKQQLEHKYESRLIQRTKELQEEFLSTLSEVQEECIKLALDIAEEVIEQKFSLDSSSLVQRVSKVLGQLREKKSLRITVHPEDLQALKDHFKSGASDRTPTITSSSNVAPGCALIEGVSGRIEINWRGKLEEIRQYIIS